jgi:hypothetical protein
MCARTATPYSAPRAPKPRSTHVLLLKRRIHAVVRRNGVLLCDLAAVVTGVPVVGRRGGPVVAPRSIDEARSNLLLALHHMGLLSQEVSLGKPGFGSVHCGHACGHDGVCGTHCGHASSYNRCNAWRVFFSFWTTVQAPEVRVRTC